MKKCLKIPAALLLAVILSLPQVLPVRAWEETLSCVTLGDSIAKGYSSDKTVTINSYGQIVSEQLAQTYSLIPDYANYAKNGLDTLELNEEILTREDVSQSLGEADIILLTVGSNDLLNELKKEAQEILEGDTKFRSANKALTMLEAAVKKNPLLVFKIINALSNWDYTEFETQWAKAMETITEHKKEGAQIIVTNIYNPVYNMNLPGTMNKVVENIIQNMNGIIEKRAREFDYRVTDLFDSSIIAYVQQDGLHPSQKGQELIAHMVHKEIYIPDENVSVQSADGNAVKGDSSEQEDTSLQQSPLDEEEEKNTKTPSPKKDTKLGLTIVYMVLVTLVISLLLIVVKRRGRGEK